MAVLLKEDIQFLQAHDFNADFGINYQLVDKANESLIVTGYIENHAGQNFSPATIAEATGVGEQRCREILKDHPLVTRNRGFHKYDQFHSIALAPEPLVFVVAEAPNPLEDLGKQARDDWYQLIQERSLAKKHRVIQKF